jgi:hypothetical protein
LVPRQRLELLDAVVAEVDLLVQLNLAGFLADDLRPQGIVLNREESCEGQNLASGDFRLMHNERIAVYTDAIATAERGLLAQTGVFFKIDDIFKNFFFADLSVFVT